MDIITAIKSGRPCRRRDWANKNFYISPDAIWPEYVLTRTDILADDWEWEEPKVEVTESAFLEAANAAADKVFVMDWMAYRDALRTVLFDKKEDVSSAPSATDRKGT
jgi:hypothetical protein